MLEVRRFADAKEVATDAAERFVEIAAEASITRGRFTVALAGGSTPRLLYQLLAAPPFRARVDWARAEVFFGDERCVPPDHPDSNFRMCRESLLDHVPILAERIHRMRGEQSDRQRAARLYQEEMAAAFGVGPDRAPPRLDLILLGLGADGHTASLFPHTDPLREGERWVVTNIAPVQPTFRLTLTAPVFERAENILFLVVGADKARALADVLEGTLDADRLPAQLIRPSGATVLWLIDAAAGSLLTNLAP